MSKSNANIGVKVAGALIALLALGATTRVSAQPALTIDILDSMLAFNPFLVTTTPDPQGAAFLLQPAVTSNPLNTYPLTQTYYYLAPYITVPLTPAQVAQIQSSPLKLIVEGNTPDPNHVTVLVPVYISSNPVAGTPPPHFVPSGPLGSVTNPEVVLQPGIPSAVQATFAQLSGGEPNNYINHYFDHGKEIYQTNIPIAPGLVKMVQVAPDGTVLLTGYFNTSGQEVIPNIALAPVVFSEQPPGITPFAP